MNLLIAFTFPILHIDLLLNFLSIYTSRRLNFFIFAGPACQVCNFDYLDIVAKSHPIVAVFHNLKGYDLHHILRNLGVVSHQSLQTAAKNSCVHRFNMKQIELRMKRRIH